MTPRPTGVFLRMLLIAGVLTPATLRSQTAPADGLRNNTPRVYAFTNARIVQGPGRVIPTGTLVIRNGVITGVGSVPVPADATIRDVKGLTIYPGLFDAYSDYGMPKPAPRSGAGTPAEKPSEPRGALAWNPAVLPQQNAAEMFLPDQKAAEKLRALGITTALVVPQSGIFRGTSALVNLGDGNAASQVVREKVAQHIYLGPVGGGYPTSLIGAIALIRQTLYDADWYGNAWEAWQKQPSLTRPETNDALAALAGSLHAKLPFVIETSDEKNLLRADAVAREFALNLFVRGSGNEFKRADAVRATGRRIILPVDFPEVPNVQTTEDALDVSLEQLRTWDEAPENPARLKKAGVTFAFSSSLMKDASGFLKQVRTAVERGLPADDALAALTTIPAGMFGVDRTLGTLDVGKTANCIITSGDLFGEKTVVYETWIDGNRYDAKPRPPFDPRGTWLLLRAGAPHDTLLLKGEPEALQGSMKRKKETKLTAASQLALRVSLTFPGDSLGYAGVVRMTGTALDDSLMGSGSWADGSSFLWSAHRIAPFVPEPDTTKKKTPLAASFPPDFPHGAFGRDHVPPQIPVLLIKGATLWTSGPAGTLQDADLLVRKGKVVAAGKNLHAPADALVIDGKGKHVTAGLIDAHSHTAVDGSVNEAGQAVSAEVRIGDAIDPDDISIYRELAGGLTVAHVLHGSANPIGGQCQLIKLRWGMSAEEMKFEGAPPTIKFALGENVKQSNWGDAFTTRYPQTRMGVEQIMRDEFRAALDYERKMKEHGPMPVRRDLELDAILEVIHGKRFIHCHSYRQDEILAMMRVAEEFGFRVKVFTHILEGYKVADIMKQHGADGSSFSDWWAYKLEVYDAIPYNGALMHEEGVLASFNSDSDELARRLNTEAAKAVKYGGVPEEEALKFVTINPARQLLVDKRVGSLEPGKDADFVIWNGPPLSTYTQCEQTWIDGRKFFDRAEDATMEDEVESQRATLIQKALTAGKSSTPDAGKKTKKEGDLFDHPHSSESGVNQ